jgi:hypothetical protein
VIYILGIVWMFTGLLTHSSVMIRKQFSVISSWAISHVSVELVYSLSETNIQTLNINCRLTWLIVWEDFTEFSYSKSLESCTELNLLQCSPEKYIYFNILTAKRHHLKFTIVTTNKGPLICFWCSQFIMQC